MEQILRNRISDLGNIDPTRVAVLAVHFQNDVLDPNGAFGPIFGNRAAGLGLVPRVASVLEAARTCGMTIVYVNVAYNPGHPEVLRNNALFRTAVERNAFVRGTRGSQVIDALKPGARDFVIEHGRISAFYGNDLEIILKSQRIETLIVTGVATNVAVDHTVRDAVQRGYDTVLLEDCCCSSDDAFHDASLLTLRALATHVLKANAFIAALSAK